MQGVALLQLLIADLIEEIATVEYFEEQLVALLAVLTHQRSECLHRWCLYLLEAVELVNAADGVEDIVALCHLHRGEVARSFRDRWFLCHD